mmetsp:Transcript_20086/g.55908  ORF Transcript_20086/g.55908 Transcript_20086/m.55908 type:complete len:270 (-) Transcript_20086:1321-2130(-)
MNQLASFIAFAFCVIAGDAFCVPSHGHACGQPHIASATIARSSVAMQMAKKRRRRQKSSPESPVTPSTPPASDTFDVDDSAAASSDLPDFELKDDVKSSKKSLSSQISVVGTDEDGNVVTDVMMGSSTQPVRSVKDLIKDRSLEKNFVFDEVADDGRKDVTKSIPDFEDFQAMAEPIDESDVPAKESKKARQAARKARALKALEEENQTTIWEKIPFVVDEKGEVNPIKLLEAGAWAGIFALVLWELYLNSPLFARSAPMVPVVYDLWM